VSAVRPAAAGLFARRRAKRALPGGARVNALSLACVARTGGPAERSCKQIAGGVRQCQCVVVPLCGLPWRAKSALALPASGRNVDLGVLFIEKMKSQKGAVVLLCGLPWRAGLASGRKVDRGVLFSEKMKNHKAASGGARSRAGRRPGQTIRNEEKRRLEPPTQDPGPFQAQRARACTMPQQCPWHGLELGRCGTISQQSPPTISLTQGAIVRPLFQQRFKRMSL